MSAHANKDEYLEYINKINYHQNGNDSDFFWKHPDSITSEYTLLYMPKAAIHYSFISVGTTLSSITSYISKDGYGTGLLSTIVTANFTYNETTSEWTLELQNYNTDIPENKSNAYYHSWEFRYENGVSSMNIPASHYVNYYTWANYWNMQIRSTTSSSLSVLFERLEIVARNVRIIVEGEVWDNASPFNNVGSGGGATHIATVTGQLSTLSSNANRSKILMVSGGGGGGSVGNGLLFNGADAGGISGSGTKSANQTTGYGFGLADIGTNVGSAGAGFYGGYRGDDTVGAGAGSGYIGNSLINSKKMVGYNVPTSSDTDTETESVNVFSETAESNKPKKGNGYAKIKLLKEAKDFEFGSLYGTSDGNPATSLSVTVTYPSDYTKAYIIIMHRDTITLPSGWELVDQQTNPNWTSQYLSVYEKTGTAGDTETITISQASNVRLAAFTIYMNSAYRLVYFDSTLIDAYKVYSFTNDEDDTQLVILDSVYNKYANQLPSNTETIYVGDTMRLAGFKVYPTKTVETGMIDYSEEYCDMFYRYIVG